MKRKIKSRPSLKKSKLDGSHSAPSPTEKEIKGKDKESVMNKVPEVVQEIMGPLVPSHPNFSATDLSAFPRMGTLISDIKAIENLSLEDLDGLQNELETLWSSLSVRIRLLQREQSLLQLHPSAPIPPDLLDPVLKMGDQVASVPSPGPSTSSGRKLGNGSLGKDLSKVDKPPKKKLKGEGEGNSKRSGDKPARAGQNRTHSISSEGDALHRAEAPSQFWEFAETYCREVSEDDLKTLDKVLEEQKEVSSDLLDIPALGKAFKEEENKREKMERTRDTCGPLTQKLVAALVDDRVSNYLNQQNNGTAKEENGESAFNRPGLIRALGLDGGSSNANVNTSLESRLRNVLFDQGLFADEDSDDLIIQNPNDEILTEIKKTQIAFKKLHHHNTTKLAELHSIVKKEVERSAIKKELEKADKEVVEAYKIISNYRLKKKQIPLSKKEKDTAIKALETRNAVLQKLSKNSHGSTNFNLF